MSGAGAANNSWTILTSEETVAETLRPLAEGTKQHEESHMSATGPLGDLQKTGTPVNLHQLNHVPNNNEIDEAMDKETTTPGPGEKNLPPNSAESAEEKLPEERYLVSEAQNADSNSNPPSVDASGTLDHGNIESKTEGLTRSSPDPDSSSDSYTLLTPSRDGPPVSLLSTETLGSAEFSPAEEELRLEETPHLQNKEEAHQEEQQSGIGERTEEGETVESRRKSLLEQIGRKEEEEEEVEEEFQVPQRENDGVFSLNKCILAALILLGLGTVFFSGVFMDFDEEGDYTTRELKDAEAPGKQEWPEVPPGLDHNSSELLNKLAEGNQQISALQAQLQAQKEELKVAKEQAAEGEEQRLLWEEVEKENSRLKTEIASLHVLQKENDRMKKELESVPALQKELETLRATVTNLKLSPAASEADRAGMKHSTSPPSDQTEDGRQDSAGPPGKQPWKTWGDQRQKKDPNRVEYQINDKKQQKGKERSTMKEGDGKELKKGDKTEWKNGKHEHGKLEKDKDKPGKQKRQSDEASPWKQKELKKEKGGRGDDGRSLEDKEGRKRLKEDRNWKKGNFEKVHERKEWTDKEKGEWRGGKHSNQKLKGEMEWKKGKHGGKEKLERKDWKEKGDKKDPEWKDKIGKEGKVKGERKQWDNSKNQGKERTGKDERKRWNEYERKSKNGKEEKKFKRKDETSEQFKSKEMKEKKHNVDWDKDQSHSLKKKNDEHEFPGNHGHKEEHMYGDRKPHHTHPKSSVGQQEYWLQQRQRLQHDSKPPQGCDTLETCAQAEGLLPVPLSEFESVLQTYLTKAEEGGVDGSKTSELRKIALEFFKDGMFVHNQRSFQDFVDDLADILEDMVEDGDEEDSDLEDEMEGFEKEVLKMFSLPGGMEKEKRIKGEWRKENRQERG